MTVNINKLREVVEHSRDAGFHNCALSVSEALAILDELEALRAVRDAASDYFDENSKGLDSDGEWYNREDALMYAALQHAREVTK